MNRDSIITLWITIGIFIVFSVLVLLIGCDTITGTDGAEYVVDCNDPFNYCGQWGSEGP